MQQLMCANPVFALQADWIVSANFGGAMIFSLNDDDVDGRECANGTFPIVSAVRTHLDIDS
jgi:hypothetical protein